MMLKWFQHSIRLGGSPPAQPKALLPPVGYGGLGTTGPGLVTQLGWTPSRQLVLSSFSLALLIHLVLTLAEASEVCFACSPAMGSAALPSLTCTEMAQNVTRTAQ